MRWLSIFLLLIVCIGCGGLEPDPVPAPTGMTYNYTVGSAPSGTHLVKARIDAAIADMTYYQDEYYPSFYRAWTTEEWIDTGSGTYMMAYDFGINTISHWYIGGLYVADGVIDAAASFYDWGVSINYHCEADPDKVDYNIRHNCFLNQTKVSYMKAGNMYVLTIPTLAWDHILEPIPIGPNDPINPTEDPW